MSFRSEFSKYGDRARKAAETNRKAGLRKLRQQQREQRLRRQQERRMEEQRLKFKEEQEQLRINREIEAQAAARKQYQRTGGISFNVDLRVSNGSQPFARDELNSADSYCGDGSAHGDRVLLPQSALTKLTGAQDALKFGAMFFEVVAVVNGTTKHTHVGVSSFSAPEGQIGITPKVARALGIDLASVAEGSSKVSASVSFVRLPKATFVQFTPISGHFVTVASESWGGVKTVLEVALRQYATLTVGDTINIVHDGFEYEMEVRALRPANAVSLIDTDVELDMTQSKAAEAHEAALAAHRDEIANARREVESAIQKLEESLPASSTNSNRQRCDIRLRVPPVVTETAEAKPPPVKLETQTWDVESNTIGSLCTFAFVAWAKAQLAVASSESEYDAGVILALRGFVRPDAESVDDMLRWEKLGLLRTHPRTAWSIGSQPPSVAVSAPLRECGFVGRTGDRPAREAIVFHFSAGTKFTPEPVVPPKPNATPSQMPRKRVMRNSPQEPHSPPALLPQGVEAFSEDDKAHKWSLIRTLGDLCNVSHRTASFYLATNKWDPGMKNRHLVRACMCLWALSVFVCVRLRLCACMSVCRRSRAALTLCCVQSQNVPPTLASPATMRTRQQTGLFLLGCVRNRHCLTPQHAAILSRIMTLPTCPRL